MRDYEELVKELREKAEIFDYDGWVETAIYLEKIADAIEELLAERTAFWVDTQPHMSDSDYKKDGMSYYCSNCHHRAGKYKHRTYKFCPWCGAKIVEKGEKDDKQYQLHG